MKDTETTTEDIKIVIPSFNQDTAYFFIQKQLSFGPRIPNTYGHQECGDFLISKLKEYKANVIIQEMTLPAFNGEKLKCRNIIAEYFPEKTKRLLLGAHWDSRPYADQDSVDTGKPIPAASDGASGVAVLLEMARLFSQYKTHPNTGVDIIFFDAEDFGQPDITKFRRQDDTYCLGSQYWSKNLHKKNYKAYFGILLDMVGAKDAHFYQEENSMTYAEDVVKKVWETAYAIGYSDYFIMQRGRGVTDDHLYVITYAGIKMIDIIHQDVSTPSHFAHYWHTHNDNLSIIDKKTLKAVGETVVNVVYNER